MKVKKKMEILNQQKTWEKKEKAKDHKEKFPEALLIGIVLLIRARNYLIGVLKYIIFCIYKRHTIENYTSSLK